MQQSKLAQSVQIIKQRGVRDFLRIASNYYLYNSHTRKNLPARCLTKPIHLQVETTRLCNLRCKMCEYSYRNGERSFMSLETFKKVFGQFPQLRSMDLTGIGEPFCNPDFMKIVRYGKKHGVKIEFSTNGLLLTEAHMDELIELDVDKISFSVDASTRETHEKIRQGSSFEKLTSHIKLLSRKKRGLRRQKPVVYLSYIVSLENILEAEAFLDLAGEVGAQTVVFRDLLVFESGDYSDKDKVESLSLQWRQDLGRKILDKARHLDIEAALPDSLSISGPKKKIFCFRPWRSAFVDVFGHMYPCCRLTQKNVNIMDYSFGHLLSQDVNEIWNNPRYGALRKTLVHPTAIPRLCEGCGCLRK